MVSMSMAMFSDKSLNTQRISVFCVFFHISHLFISFILKDFTFLAYVTEGYSVLCYMDT